MLDVPLDPVPVPENGPSGNGNGIGSGNDPKPAKGKYANTGTCADKVWCARLARMPTIEGFLVGVGDPRCKERLKVGHNRNWHWTLDRLMGIL